MPLVISRDTQRFNPGEQCKFRVGDDVIVTILCVKSGNSVRVMIEAPKTVQVDREEVWQRKHLEQQQPPEPARRPSRSARLPYGRIR